MPQGEKGVISMSYWEEWKAVVKESRFKDPGFKSSGLCGPSEPQFPNW